MTDDTKKLVHKWSAVSAGIGVVFSPVPLLDEIALFPFYSVFARKIAKRHELTWKQTPWRPILKTTAAGLVARAGVNVALAALPGVSAVWGAATAAALTELLGPYIDHACADPANAKSLPVKEIFDALKALAHKAEQAGQFYGSLPKGAKSVSSAEGAHP